MRVGNFECQIAQSQIGRYLSGEGLSNEAVRQLNLHVGSCEDCQEVLKQRKAALVAMMGPAPTQAAVEIETPEPSLRDRLRSQLASAVSPPAKDSRSTAPARPSYTKPILYSVALAVVMLAMSYLAKNPTTILGERATALPPAPSAQAITPIAPADTPAIVPQEPSDKQVVSTGPAAVTKPEPEKPIGQPPVVKVAQPIPNALPKTRKTPRRVPIRRPATRPAAEPFSGIRVYDATGRPIQPK